MMPDGGGPEISSDFYRLLFLKNATVLHFSGNKSFTAATLRSGDTRRSRFFDLDFRHGETAPAVRSL